MTWTSPAYFAPGYFAPSYFGTGVEDDTPPPPQQQTMAGMMIQPAYDRPDVAPRRDRDEAALLALSLLL